MHLYHARNASDFTAQSEFSKWLLEVSTEQVSTLNNIDSNIDLPSDIVLPSISLQDLITAVYPNLLSFLENSELLLKHAILVLRNKHVSEITDIVIKSLFNNTIHSFSADSLDSASTSTA
ncbi:11530_t:CDS:1 [Cetraspora pellucida]|uniref:11530_t:CDS:1 n=1 Tax=Cetraspora pellucida TaxID=1433469 RepID=A0ACA9KRK6_9GLOM|nr:11530_t:CDS:1 [Cetraspora pellucida]